jgi:hypothetical protein
MTLKEESVIEMIAYTKTKKNFGCDFPWFRFTIQKMSYHTGCLYKEMLLKREIRKKKRTDKRINSKQ